MHDVCLQLSDIEEFSISGRMVVLEFDHHILGRTITILVIFKDHHAEKDLKNSVEHAAHNYNFQLTATCTCTQL